MCPTVSFCAFLLQLQVDKPHVMDCLIGMNDGFLQLDVLRNNFFLKGDQKNIIYANILNLNLTKNARFLSSSPCRHSTSFINTKLFSLPKKKKLIECLHSTSGSFFSIMFTPFLCELHIDLLI